MPIRGVVTTSAVKLSKAERRHQILQKARELIRVDGTDALTLGSVADRAGVSKPLVYEHFGSRSGLLIALYQQLDEQQVQIAQEALDGAETLQDSARVLSDAYMECCNTIGGEWMAISAAVKGNEEMEVVQRELTDRYVAMYVEAFLPFVDLAETELRIRCVGILGAAESISREMLRGRIGQDAASRALGTFIVASLATGLSV